MARPVRYPICPDCKTFVPADASRCPACGRKAERPRPVPWYSRPWVLWSIPVVILLLWIAVAAVQNPTPTLAVGGHAVVRHVGARGAWFAVDDESYDQMLDGQNKGSQDLLDYLFSKGKTFREPNGSRVLLLKVGFASAFVQVREGANVGSEGWVQKEMLEPAAH